MDIMHLPHIKSYNKTNKLQKKLLYLYLRVQNIMLVLRILIINQYVYL